MIAKITKGSRPGDIAAYLHGRGKANEHRYRLDDDREHEGGRVIGGNLGREGDTQGKSWDMDMRSAIDTRERKTKDPVWHVSLRNAPGDRHLSDAEWAEAGQLFAERMGYADHPWVMVRHGDDHVHIVASRVDERGKLWSHSKDFYKAQSARAELEKRYGLTQVPKTKSPGRKRMPQREVNEQQRRREEALAADRGQPTSAADRRIEREQRRTEQEMLVMEQLQRPQTPEEQRVADERKTREVQQRTEGERHAQRMQGEAMGERSPEERAADERARDRHSSTAEPKSRREQTEELFAGQREGRDASQEQRENQTQHVTGNAEPKSRREQTEEFMAKQREERDREREGGIER